MTVGPSNTAPIPTARPVARLNLNISSIRAIDSSFKRSGRAHRLHVGKYGEFSTARTSPKSTDCDRVARHHGCAIYLYDCSTTAGVPDTPCMGDPPAPTGKAVRPRRPVARRASCGDGTLDRMKHVWVACTQD